MFLALSTKSELIANREKFIRSKEKLQKLLKDQGVDFDESLDSETLKIVLSPNVRYQNDDYISIANNLIVCEFLKFTIRKIDQKVLEIEKEILGEIEKPNSRLTDRGYFFIYSFH